MKRGKGRDMAAEYAAVREILKPYVERAEAAEAEVERLRGDLEACSTNAVDAIAAYRKRAEAAEAKLPQFEIQARCDRDEIRRLRTGFMELEAKLQEVIDAAKIDIVEAYRQGESTNKASALENTEAQANAGAWCEQAKQLEAKLAEAQTQINALRWACNVSAADLIEVGHICGMTDDEYPLRAAQRIVAEVARLREALQALLDGDAKDVGAVPWATLCVKARAALRGGGEHSKHPTGDYCVYCLSQWPCAEAGEVT